MLDESNGVGGFDSSVSADTSPVETTESVEIAPQTVETTDVPTIEEVTETTTEAEDTDPEIEAEVEELLKTEDDKTEPTPLHKHLRQIIRQQKYELKSLKNAPPTENVAEAVELHQGLYAFDTEQGVPTTKPFAERVYQKSPEVAEQALWDLANQADANGMTLGHKFFEKVGLDPYRLDDYRKLTKGEIDGEQFGIIEVPSSIPPEYAETYKSLSPSLRYDLQFNLESDLPEGQRDALRMLDNEKFRFEAEKEKLQAQTVAEAEFRTSISQAVETQVLADYGNILDSIKKSPAFESVKIHSNPQIDSFAKESLITEINALGDPNSVLSNRAIARFDAMGVKVDKQTVQSLMSEIETQTQIAVTAEKNAKKTGRNYTPQIQEALNRKAEAVQKAVAYGNKIFSQALAKMTNGTSEPKPVGGLPASKGNAPSANESAPKVMSPQELDNWILGTAKSLAGTN